jgi:NifU-like protein involved in Fe-S cluster formation
MSNNLTEEELSLLKEAGYTKKAIEIYLSRVNVGLIENPDVAIAYKGPCGDMIKLFLKIGDDLIDEAKFQYLGCPASAVCGSMLTQMIKGKTLLDAKKITKDDLLRELGSIPDEECHCAQLAITALKKTILRYEKNNERA